MANSVDPDQSAPSLFWVHTVCFYTLFVGYIRQLFAADDFGRRHFQMHFFLGALRVKTWWFLIQKLSKSSTAFPIQNHSKNLKCINICTLNTWTGRSGLLVIKLSHTQLN